MFVHLFTLTHFSSSGQKEHGLSALQLNFLCHNHFFSIMKKSRGLLTRLNWTCGRSNCLLHFITSFTFLTASFYAQYWGYGQRIEGGGRARLRQ